MKAKIIYNGKEAEIEITKEILKVFEIKKKEPRRFIPNDGEFFYYIGNLGEVFMTCKKNRDDEILIANGNCYKTSKEAKHMVDKQRLLVELQDFADINNEEIDWNDVAHGKHFIYFNYCTKTLCTTWQNWSCCIAEQVYFSSKTIADSAIKIFGDRIKKYLFNIKE